MKNKQVNEGDLADEICVNQVLLFLCCIYKVYIWFSVILYWLFVFLQPFLNDLVSFCSYHSYSEVGGNRRLIEQLQRSSNIFQNCNSAKVDLCVLKMNHRSLPKAWQ